MNPNQTNINDQAIQTAMEHHQAGRLLQAEAIYQQILQIEPSHPDALHFLGVIAYQAGKSEIAIELISKAISASLSGFMLGVEAICQQKLQVMHFNLGLALQAQDKLDAAIESYHKALSINPHYAEVHNSMGLALQAQGKLNEAVDSYHRAILLKPYFVDAYSNMGNALQAQGKLDAAVENYRHALLLKPDLADTHYNLGFALQAQGRLEDAIVNHQRAFQLRGSHEDKIGFARCIRKIKFTHEIAGIRPLVIYAISEPWSRPGDLVAASISLIELNHGIKTCVDRVTNSWPTRLPKQELFGHSGLASISNDQLLQCLLENAPVCNVGLERFLTVARFAMLEAAKATVIPNEMEEKILAFYCALARQCFINEYVFAYTDKEFDQAQLLRDQLAAALESGSPVPVLWLAAVAAYFPLFSLPSAETLLDQLWPESVASMLVQQIQEPLEERQLRADMPKLTTVEDDVSRLVQQQYEENPYPKWVKLPSVHKTTMVDTFLRQLFPSSPFKPLGKNDEIDILIAGCGTGQQSIETAQRFRGAKVLAVDLSLTSLSYAKRKTRELGLKNIEYAQADIMKLGAIRRTFDVIESVGVLHHLADPMAGWRILLSLLRPGGFMRLGFYSELARQYVVAARSFIAEHGYTSNTEDIRRCRQELMAMENSIQFDKLTSSSDFYGISTCRDLLFHVQEHRYTLPQLKKNLGELGLNLIGFSLEHNILEQYRERFPDDKSRTNLDYWNTLENENPDMFFYMYQFWVQKQG